MLSPPSKPTKFGVRVTHINLRWISYKGLLGGDSITDRRMDGRRRLQYHFAFIGKRRSRSKCVGKDRRLHTNDFRNINYKVNFKDFKSNFVCLLKTKDIKHVKRDFHSFVWVMP